MIAGVVLAAGTARRFGAQKLLLPIGNEPLVRRAVQPLLHAGLDRVYVVLGREAGPVREALDGLPVNFVVNPRFAEGMSTSLRAGIEALPPEVEAALVALGDQPVPPTILTRLLQAWRTSRAAIVAPSYHGERGNPVLFSASLFEELRSVSGDQGGRGVLQRHRGQALMVPIAHAPPPDIDTPEDYAAFAPEMARGVQPSEKSETDHSIRKT